MTGSVPAILVDRWTLISRHSAPPFELFNQFASSSLSKPTRGELFSLLRPTLSFQKSGLFGADELYVEIKGGGPWMLRTRVVPDSHYLKSFELTSVSPNTPFYTFSTVILSITCSSPKVPFLLDRLLDTLRHPGHLPLPSVSLRPPYFLSPLPAFRPITLVEHLFRPPSPKSPSFVYCPLAI